MLGEIPASIDVWAGRDVCEDDGMTHWLYSWRTDSIRGLPLDRTLLAFYTNDERFESFWDVPDKYTSKLINSGIKYAISPNYSLWADASRSAHLYNTFRSRWIARYFQDAGITIIPDINWADESSFEFCLLGIPYSPPAIAVQLQTVKLDSEVERAVSGLKIAVERLQPGSILVYGYKAAHKIVEKAGLALPITFVSNRSERRRAKFESLKKEVLR
jgi:hypothetical protein